MINVDELSKNGDKEKYLSCIKDTVEHKKYVLDSCYAMAEYLFDVGKHNLAMSLMRRAAKHDDSKFRDAEMSALASIYESDNCMRDPNELLTEDKKAIIDMHWKSNSHHPEHYEKAEDMTELDRIEMVCDMHARSRQYKTYLLGFIRVRQQNRFHFPEEEFKEIMRYCEILEEKLPTLQEKPEKVDK